MNGLQRTFSLPTKGIITHVQFLQNHGLLVAAVLLNETPSIYIWEINSGKFIDGPIVLPEGE